MWLHNLGRFFISILLFVALIAMWHFSVVYFQVPAFIVPEPLAVMQSLIAGLKSGLYIEHAGVTLLETVVGFAAGFVLATALGALVAISPRAEFYLYPYIVMFQSIPKVALAPIVAVWFGLGLSSKVVNVAIICFFPLLVNTITGLKSVQRDRLNLMRSLGASEWQVFTMLRVPGALPFIMAGVQISVVLSLIGAIVAEFVGAQKGLGVLIQSVSNTMDVAALFSLLIVLSVIGLCLNAIVTFVSNKLLFWDTTRKTGSLQ